MSASERRGFGAWGMGRASSRMRARTMSSTVLLGFDGAGAIRFSYVMRGIVAPKVGVVPWQLRQFFASTASTSQGRPFAVGVGVVDVGVTVGDGPASEAGSTPAVVPQAKATADPSSPLIFSRGRIDTAIAHG